MPVNERQRNALRSVLKLGLLFAALGGLRLVLVYQLYLPLERFANIMKMRQGDFATGRLATDSVIYFVGGSNVSLNIETNTAATVLGRKTINYGVLAENQDYRSTFSRPMGEIIPGDWIVYSSAHLWRLPLNQRPSSGFWAPRFFKSWSVLWMIQRIIRDDEVVTGGVNLSQLPQGAWLNAAGEVTTCRERMPFKMQPPSATFRGEASTYLRDIGVATRRWRERGARVLVTFPALAIREMDRAAWISQAQFVTRQLSDLHVDVLDIADGISSLDADSTHFCDSEVHLLRERAASFTARLSRHIARRLSANSEAGYMDQGQPSVGAGSP